MYFTLEITVTFPTVRWLNSLLYEILQLDLKLNLILIETTQHIITTKRDGLLSLKKKFSTEAVNDSTPIQPNIVTNHLCVKQR